jgi:hypothetical protein
MRRMLAKVGRSLICVWLMTFQNLAYANCLIPEDGMIVTVVAKSCQAINGDTHPEVKEHAGPMYETWNLKKAYTGALILDERGGQNMYPSKASEPCKEFPVGKPVKKRLYQTCCDSGRWGKCVFGGRFLGDIDGPKINAFQ